MTEKRLASIETIFRAFDVKAEGKIKLEDLFAKFNKKFYIDNTGKQYEKDVSFKEFTLLFDTIEVDGYVNKCIYCFFFHI